MYSVYKISIGDYFYIGCSKRINKRITQHRCDLKHNRHPNHKLSEAFNKSSNFDWEILCEVEERKEAFKTERGLLKKEKGNEYCCNLLSKEEGNRKGIKHSEQSKAKISKINKGKKLSEETKEKIRQSQKIRKSLLNRNTIYQCPHCDKSSTNYRSMARWHYDNCKHKS